MRKIRKRVFAAVLAAALLVTTPGMTSYAEAADAQTEDISESVTGLAEDDAAAETEAIQEPEAEDSDTDKPETGDDVTEDSETDEKEPAEDETVPAQKEDAGQEDTGAQDDSANLCVHHKEHTKDCGYSPASEDGEESPCTYECRICPIEDLIAALPDEVTEGNAEKVRAQLNKILALYRELTAEEQEQIDLTRCYDLQAALDEANAPMAAVGDVVLSKSNPTVTFTDGECGSDCQGHTITQTGTLQYATIIVESGTHNVTFSGLNITPNAHVGVMPDATMNLTLMDTNTIQGEIGIYVPEDATLVIEGSGSLTVSASNSAAGIGGAYYEPNGNLGNCNCGTVTINGGTITATGASLCAGIGGGAYYATSGNGGTVNINGGTVTATGGGDSWEGGAGIGGGTDSGKSGSGGTLTINGGNVTLTAGHSTAYGFGRGSGSNSNAGTLTLADASCLTLTDGTTLDPNGTYSINGDPTEDMIVVPTDLVYTGQTHDLTGKIYIDDSKTGTAEYFGQTFNVSASAEGWAYTISPAQVKEDGKYTVTFTKGGKSISTTFTVAECPHTGLVYTPQENNKHGGTCPVCGEEVSEEHTWVDGTCPVCNLKAVVQVESDNATTYYGNITDAWTAASGKTATITLLDDVTAIILSVLSGDNITLEGGSCTLSMSDFLVGGGQLDITGGTFEMSGLTVKGGTVHLSGGTFRIGNGGGIACDSGVASLLLNYGTATEPHYAYFDEAGKPIELEEGQMSLTGTVTVKECDHPGVTPTPNGNGTHSKTCPYCGYSETAEGCFYIFSGNEGTCTCGDKLTVEVTGTDGLKYDGTAKEPGVTVKRGDTELATSAYTVTYANNKDAGTNTASVTVTIGNNRGTYTKTFSIGKATPTITWGAGTQTQTVTYTGNLAVITPPTVTLVNGETFDGTINYSYIGTSTGDDLPTNAGTYSITASIEAEGNYTDAATEMPLTLTIGRAEGILTVPETPFHKKYGEADFSLECSSNGDGKISYVSDNEAVAVVSADGMAQLKGLGIATITVSLAEGTNHTAAADKTVTITVERGENAPNMPDSVINVSNICSKVGDVTLPENWEWQEKDREKALQEETAVEAVAVYIGADKDNYETVTATVAVMSHIVGEEILYTGKDEKEPTCTEAGVGHRECVTCHVVVESGITVEALGHDYKGVVTKEPTTSKEGEMTYTCSRCGDTYTEVIPKKIPEGLWISGLEESVPYTGSAVKPEGIRVYHGSTLLREKTEYTLSYKNNTKAGTAQVIVTGKGSYKGKATAEFTIEAVDLHTDANVSAFIATVAETGKNLKPTVTVTWNGRKLKEKTDYTLTYEANIKTASAEGYDVTINGKGNYTGTIVEKFHVVPKGTPLLNKATVKGLKKSYEYQVSEPDGSMEGQNAAPKGLEDDLEKITVQIGSNKLTRDTDYTVRVENGNTVGTGTIVLEAAPTGAYAGEKRISINITGTNIKKCYIAGLEKTYPYTGGPVMPEISVYTGKNGTGTQIPSDAYTVLYSNYINQGKATVTVTGIPEKGYSGSVKATYSIGRLNLAAEKTAGSITVKMPDDIIFAKGGAKPQPVITHSIDGTERILREGVDYTLKYSNNTTKYDSAASTNTKKPTLKITGAGNYTGTITENFDIGAQDIGKLNITAADKAYNSKKKGSYYYSVPKVYDVDGKQLKSGKDYTVEYTNAGTGAPIEKTDTVENGTQLRATVTARENSSYSGSLSTTYYVRDAKEVKDIAKVKSDKIASQQYTGSEIRPEVGFYTQTGKTKNYLTEEDYEIIGYYNNVKKGTATILIRGKNAYSGVKSITFKITAADNKSIWSGIFN